MLVILTAILAFVTIAGLGFVFAGGSGNELVVKRTKAIAERARAEPSKIRTDKDPERRRKQILKSLKEQEKQQRKASLTLKAKLQQAGLSIGPRTFWIICAVVGVVVTLLGLLMAPSPLIAIGLGFGLGFGLPRWVVGFLGKRRAAKFVAAFPDATDIIVRGIKSGLPLHDCLKIIAREAPVPLGPEFRRLVENLGLGLSTDQALDKMFERMPLSELRFFAIVLAIQQKSGGNLAEALGNLSGVLRSRKMMREKIKALSGEATASAAIIGSLPPGVMALVSVTTPSYMAPMFTDPRGQILLMGGAFWMSVGIWVMRRMINFKF
ncbi:MAG TPA: type II secretion system F family protein [Caulobacteraceae bacterium]|jgi:tight adherence protein B